VCTLGAVFLKGFGFKGQGLCTLGAGGGGAGGDWFGLVFLAWGGKWRLDGLCGLRRGVGVVSRAGASPTDIISSHPPANHSARAGRPTTGCATTPNRTPRS